MINKETFKRQLEFNPNSEKFFALLKSENVNEAYKRVELDEKMFKYYKHVDDKGIYPVIEYNEYSYNLLVLELKEFYYIMCEDWHLWDEREQGVYPIQRTLDAMKKFIDNHEV